MRRTFLVLAAIIGLAVVRPAAAREAHASTRNTKGGARRHATAATRPALDPKAIDLLKAMSTRLAAAHTMTFTAVTTYESPSRLGPPLAYTTTSDVTLQRPDKLRVLTPADGPASEFYYDGQQMMAYAPAENLLAVAKAPPTIDAALKAAFDSAGIYFPFTDVVVADPYADIAPDLERAFVIGQSHVVGGTTTDMIAVVTHGVFGQIWIGADDKLPRMIRAVFANDASRLRHQVELSNWHLDGDVAADAFSSARLDAARRIEFARPDASPASATGTTRKRSHGKKKAGHTK